MITRRAFLPAAPLLPYALVGLLRPPPAAGAEKLTFRVATSAAMLGDVNENDARAALRSWADVVSGIVGMNIDYERHFLSTPEQLRDLMRQRAIDAVGCTVVDYLPFAEYVDPSGILVDANGRGQEYILLVHRDSRYQKVADLRGRPLTFYRHQYTCLALDWLETLLNASNLEPAERFFAEIKPNLKLSRTVLPVFFRQSDACVVTRDSFNTMVELNPQLGRTLRVIAASPLYTTALFCFHRDCVPAVKVRFRSALVNLAQSPTGKQLLALFQTTGFSARDASVLRSAAELIENAARIRRRFGIGGA
jgi:ABC-type phosphate/phosphonate transport system substrate-binding protein